MAGCVIALSRSNFVMWQTQERLFILHIQSYLNTKIERALSFGSQETAVPILVKCGWTLLDMRQDSKLSELLEETFAGLEKNSNKASKESLPLYDLRIRSLYSLEKDKEAVALLRQVVDIQEKRLAPDHPSRLASQHELALACRAISVYADTPLLRKTSTRLLKLLPSEDEVIRCHIDVVDLETKPHYQALSYTWGAPTRDAKAKGVTQDRSCSIICNGFEICITKNLFQFLRFASQRIEEYSECFWIDAICINQDDKVEKSSEVGKMGQIYGAAASVLVWLGDGDEHSDKAIELINVLVGLPADSLTDLNSENMREADVVTSKLGSSITPEH